MPAPPALNVNLISHSSSSITTELSEFLQQCNILTSKPADYILHLYATHLELAHASDAKTCIRVDFNDNKTRWRQRQSELLHRAIGITEQRKPRVLDTTAGMGQDAFAIASRGSVVTMVEQHPLIYLLLQDGLQRSHKTGSAIITSRMDLIFADAKQVLNEYADEFDVIYLDPMFPEKRSSAKTKKAMQLFRQMVREEADDGELLELARAKAKHRVVIKRPIKAPVFAGVEPGYTLKGRNIRYDIFGLKAF